MTPSPSLCPQAGLCLPCSSPSLQLGLLPVCPPAPASCRQIPSKLDGAFPGGNNAPDWGQRALPHGSGAGCHGGGCPARRQAILGKREEEPSSSGGWERPRASQHGRSLHRGFEDARPCSCSWHRARSRRVLTWPHPGSQCGVWRQGDPRSCGHPRAPCSAWQSLVAPSQAAEDGDMAGSTMGAHTGTGCWPHSCSMAGTWLRALLSPCKAPSRRMGWGRGSSRVCGTRKGALGQAGGRTPQTPHHIWVMISAGLLMHVPMTLSTGRQELAACTATPSRVPPWHRRLPCRTSQRRHAPPLQQHPILGHSHHQHCPNTA